MEAIVAKTRQKIITLQQTWSEKEQELQEEKLQLNTHLTTVKAKNEIEETERYSNQQTEDHLQAMIKEKVW